MLLLFAHLRHDRPCMWEKSIITDILEIDFPEFKDNLIMWGSLGCS